MNTISSEEKGRPREEMSLAPSQKDRLRAAMRILMDYLLENGYLIKNRSMPVAAHERDEGVDAKQAIPIQNTIHPERSEHS